MKLCAAVNVTLSLGAYTAKSTVAGQTYTTTGTLISAIASTTFSGTTSSSSSQSSTSTSGAFASATSSGPVATVTVPAQKKSHPGKIAGIVIGSVLGVALIAGIAFYYGRRAHYRQAQGKLSSVETTAEAAHFLNEPKGPAELSSPLVSPTSNPHEMESPMTSGYPNTRFSEVAGASHPAVELPAEPIRYEK